MQANNDDFAWHLSRLRQVQEVGQLVFILGAGINRAYGLPVWNELLEGLLLHSGRIPRLRLHGKPLPKSALEEETQAVRHVLNELSADPLLQAAMVRAAYTSGPAWIEALRQQLTPRAGSKRAEDESGPLRVIARMLVDAAVQHERKNIPVLTFNYDELLETAVNAELAERRARGTLKQSNSPALRSIATERDFKRFSPRPGISIYHLHGFLGATRPAPVLDPYSYVEVLKGDHWSWTCMRQVLVGTNATALLIGLSLSDPSLRFVLTHWAVGGDELMGFYLAAPPPVPAASTLPFYRQFAFASRSILELYDEVMDRLQLVCYHLSSWGELVTILRSIGTVH